MKYKILTNNRKKCMVFKLLLMGQFEEVRENEEALKLDRDLDGAFTEW